MWMEMESLQKCYEGRAGAVKGFMERGEWIVWKREHLILPIPLTQEGMWTICMARYTISHGQMVRGDDMLRSQS